MKAPRPKKYTAVPFGEVRQLTKKAAKNAEALASDIDTILLKIKNALLRDGVATMVEHIAAAKVPILNFSTSVGELLAKHSLLTFASCSVSSCISSFHLLTGIKVDISVGDDAMQSATDAVQRCLDSGLCCIRGRS